MARLENGCEVGAGFAGDTPPPSRLARDMTLREHYAGLAMAALIVDPNSGGDIAKYAVRHADALLAALKDGGSE